MKPLGVIADAGWQGFRDGDWIESKDQSQSGIRLLQLADIGEGSFLDRSSKYISVDTFHRLGCTEVLPGDLLIARMAEPIGRACVIPQLACKCVTAVDCCIVRLDLDTQDRRYWNLVLNTPSWTRCVEARAAGTTRARISRRNLESIEVPMPSVDKQRSVADELCRIQDGEMALQTRQKAVGLLKGKLLEYLTPGGSL